NRHQLSSEAAGARMRLIERIFDHPTKPLLGMDSKGKPPEMSMYLSVLRRAGLHRETEDGWSLALPPSNNDLCRVRPVLERIQQILEEASDARVRVIELFDRLREPPFGVRS